ncbi:hypothetical protein GGR57DRAFT_482024 [Xylariaceae sp. FL1272]|nr:hypothetical protein GGR57DRAFT_482024 [Xylariaceae sp. FL1272]
MKLSVALYVSAVSAATLPEGLPLSAFGSVISVSPEEAASGSDIGFKLSERAVEGLPLSAFGEVHHVTPDEARHHKDLGGNNYTDLPVFGPGHHKDLRGWLDWKANHASHSAGHAFGQVSDEVEDIIDDSLEPRDAGDCANPNVRYEWDNYSASDKTAFVNAIQCLINKPPSGRISASKNRYEDIVRLHQSYAPNIHSRSTSAQTHKFLLWHRYYLWAFEQILRDECGFNRAMPWWDEKKWAGRFAQSTLFQPAYFGSLPGPTNGRGTCIYNGKFSGLQTSLGPGTATNNPHCVQRAVNEGVTAQTGQSSYDICQQRTSYPDFHSCVEFTYHAQGHNGVGATMADAIASPGDPAFFMHHSYVDYTFRKWQLGDLSRRTTISGCASSNGCPALTLDTMIYMGNICGAKCPDLPVRQVLRTLQGHFCYKYNY